MAAEIGRRNGLHHMVWLIVIGIVAWVIYLAIQSKKTSSTQKRSSYGGYQRSVERPRSPLNEKRVDLSSIKLSEEQQQFFNEIESSSNHFFITGKAGTGKSVLLQYLKQASARRLVVAAPTGVAALNVGGQTIHSLFRVPPAFIAQNSLRVDRNVALLLKNIDSVVIDEISMVRADLMDAIDHLLRQARNNALPFGGVQMIMFGDLYQLPPVVSDPALHQYFNHNHGGFYFFNATVWGLAKMKIMELSHVFRQSDEAFISILNAIRIGKVSEQQLQNLNQRAATDIPEHGIVTLSTTNNAVTTRNSRHLNALEGNLFRYEADIQGQLDQSSFPTEKILEFKKGAQVMLLKNDRDKRWVNGTIGYIQSLSETEIKVNIDDIVYSVPKETWKKIRYYYDQEKRKIEEEIVSSFTQFPLRLAWAITIHKSQGQTYGSVAVDMGNGAFAHGQSYVALSRCRSLDGLYLKRELLPEDIIVDQSVITFMAQAVHFTPSC